MSPSDDTNQQANRLAGRKTTGTGRSRTSPSRARFFYTAISATGVLAVTAFAGLEDRKRALAAGFDDHVPKPIDPERFIVTLANLLKGS